MRTVNARGACPYVRRSGATPRQTSQTTMLSSALSRLCELQLLSRRMTGSVLQPQCGCGAPVWACAVSWIRDPARSVVAQ
eukprot:3490653-Rhodomonas_salina.3